MSQDLSLIHIDVYKRQPAEAAAKIDEQKKEITAEPKNLEEQAISLVGRDIYELSLIHIYSCYHYSFSPYKVVQPFRHFSIH